MVIGNKVDIIKYSDLAHLFRRAGFGINNQKNQSILIHLHLISLVTLKKFVDVASNNIPDLAEFHYKS